MRHKYLLALLLFSGFAGLSYELLWVRLLALSFGSTTLSFSTVLAVFFGGLALGAWIGGRWAPRFARPAKMYAFLEIATGVAGFFLYFLLSNLGSLFAAIDPGPNIVGALVRFLVSLPILILPTLMMGATLPFVTRAMVVADEEVGEGTALIYGINTLGAFLGAYATTFHLLPALGIFGTNALTALVNLAVGAAALALERGEPATAESPAVEAEDADDVPRKVIRTALGLTFVGGFAAIALQVVWARLFAVFLEGTVYAVGSVLMAVLIGIGVGSVGIARLLKRARHPGAWFVALQVITGLSLVLIERGLPWISYILQDPPVTTGGLGRLHAQLAIVVMVLLVPTTCLGASFPALISIVERRATNASRSLGNLYAVNTVGSILGSLIGGFFLLPVAGSAAALYVGLVLVCGVGAVGALILARSGPRVLPLTMVLAALLPLAFFEGHDPRTLTRERPIGYAATAKKNRDRRESLIYFEEGRAATVAVRLSGSNDGRSLTLNGLGQGGRMTLPPHLNLESILVAAVPYVHAPVHDSALVVGLGAGQTVDVMVDLGVKEVKVIEIERAVVDAVRALEQAPKSILDDPRVDVEINDARHFLLLNQRTDHRFDIITSMPAHPWVAPNIFTKEFFELARDNLSKNGVFSTWFGVDKMDREAVRSLLRAFVSAFPNYAVYDVTREVSAYYLVGSPAPLSFDLARFRRLAEHPLMLERAVTQDPLFLPSRVYATGTARTPPPPAGAVNTDDTAYVELHAPRTSTTTARLNGFMPAEHILPELVRTSSPASSIGEVLEAQLGTPGGTLPIERTVPRIARADATFRGWQDRMSETERAYFLGRLALLRGRFDAARRSLSEATSSPDPRLARRAAKFVALAHRSEAERADALLAAPRSSDVLVMLADLDVSRALAAVPDEPRDPAADPYGWLLWRAAHPKDAPNERERSAVVAGVGAALSKTNSIAMLELCARVLSGFEMHDMVRQCRAWSTERRRAKVRSLLAAGRNAGAVGSFTQAAQALERALELDPSNPEVIELLMRSWVETGNRAGIARLRRLLRFRGAPESRIVGLETAARAAKLSRSEGTE